ncbi:MAG: hypothetical protein Q9220_003383 [cf. Caloplaca sp. 1 TL-2023]
MHLSTVLSLALAVSPLAVTARGNLGFALGARKAGPKGECKTTQDYESDFDTLKGKAGSTIVRTYNVVDTNVPAYPCNVAAAILPAAASRGFKVILGLSADTQDAYAAERDALKPVLTSAVSSSVYALTVGSESIYRGVKACDLLPRILDAKTAFSSLVPRIGTVDSWNKFADGTADPLFTGVCEDGTRIKGSVSFVLVNAFGYWQGKTIKDATKTYLDDLQQAIGHIQDLAGLDTVEIMNGETGWPGDGGSNYGAAQASTANEESFFKSGVCAALAWGIDVFYFEAFDETWKPKSTGDTGAQGDETHWGAFDDQRTPKFSLAC